MVANRCISETTRPTACRKNIDDKNDTENSIKITDFTARCGTFKSKLKSEMK